MSNLDQATGLRRLLEIQKPRVFTFLSALPEEEKSGMLINLGAALAAKGLRVLMVDARSSTSSIGAWVAANADQTLLDVARQQRTMDEVIKQISAGLSVAMLARQQLISANIQPENCRRLSRAFDVAVHKSDLVLVDAQLDLHDAFPLSSFDDSEIVIQVSANPATIKSAYALIKRVSNRIGRRHYSILVTDASEAEAKRVFENLEQTASRYLAVPLNFLGFVPHDAYLQKATGLGRSVMDAFPFAKASQAFVRLAESLSRPTTLHTGLRHFSELGADLKI